MRLFGTDGVRGRAGTDITPMVALKLGIAAGMYFKGKHLNNPTNKVLVGKDTRKSGYMIENAIVSGLTSTGLNVIQVGPMPTPATAFLTKDMRCSGGIMISASHNPYYDNGIKFFNQNGCKLSQKEEEEIEVMYKSLDTENLSKMNPFKSEKEIGYSKRIDDVIGRYIAHVKRLFPNNLTLGGVRIVLDCANGAAYKVGAIVLEELGADLIVINDEPNGYNINDNCGAMFPNGLANEVKRLRADIGFALDGDSDRLVAVDDNGEIINGDKLIGALGMYLKKRDRLKNDGVVVTVMSNVALHEFFKENGIRLDTCDVGDKSVLDMMNKLGYSFGGEQSGHIIISDGNTGDGIACALLALEVLITTNKSSSVIFNPFEIYPQVQSSVLVSKKTPLQDIKGLKAILDDLDTKSIRHLIRYSGTENKLRILLEGKDISVLNSTKDMLEDFFRDKIK